MEKKWRKKTSVREKASPIFRQKDSDLLMLLLLEKYGLNRLIFFKAILKKNANFSSAVNGSITKRLSG